VHLLLTSRLRTIEIEDARLRAPRKDNQMPGMSGDLIVTTAPNVDGMQPRLSPDLRASLECSPATLGRVQT